MPSKLDQTFGLPMRGLQVFEARSRVIANNLSNADTPGYQARDIDFREVLGRQLQDIGPRSRVESTGKPGHLPVGTDPEARVYRTKYRIAAQNSADLNSVEAAAEKAQYAENSVRYQAAFYFLDGRIQSLMSAIKGE